MNAENNSRPIFGLKIIDFYRSLHQESERGAALVAAAALEDSLGQLLGAYFLDNNKVRDRVLDNRGPLSSFASRIDIAYLLGLITKRELIDLNIIRKIRNEFAHSSSMVSFSDQSVEARCRELSLGIAEAHGLIETATPRDRFEVCAGDLLGSLNACMTVTEHRVSNMELSTLEDGLSESQKKAHVASLLLDSIDYTSKLIEDPDSAETVVPIQYHPNTDKYDALGDADERTRRRQLLNEPHMRPLTDFVQFLRKETGLNDQIPDFDPCDGGTQARTLILSQRPSKEAIQTGFESRNNKNEISMDLMLLLV